MKILQLGLVAALTTGLAAIFIYITGVSHSYERFGVSSDDLSALSALQDVFKKCVKANGLGLQAIGGSDYCQVTIRFPSDTIPKWEGWQWNCRSVACMFYH